MADPLSRAPAEEPDAEGIAARLAKITPGPWGWENATSCCGHPCTVDGCPEHDTGVPQMLYPVGLNAGDVLESMPDEAGRYEQWLADAAFIAHAPADVAALLAERARLIAMLHAVGAAGAICPTHGKAVLVTHVDDGEPCGDYLQASSLSRAPTEEAKP